MNENRRWPRIALHLEVSLRFPSVDEAAAASTIDVSRCGVYLSMSTPKPIGTTVRLVVHVGDGDMELEGVVVREDLAGVAVFLTKVSEGWERFCDEMTERKQNRSDGKSPLGMAVVERVRKSTNEER